MLYFVILCRVQPFPTLVHWTGFHTKAVGGFLVFESEFVSCVSIRVYATNQPIVGQKLSLAFFCILANISLTGTSAFSKRTFPSQLLWGMTEIYSWK